MTAEPPDSPQGLDVQVEGPKWDPIKHKGAWHLASPIEDLHAFWYSADAQRDNKRALKAWAAKARSTTVRFVRMDDDLAVHSFNSECRWGLALKAAVKKQKPTPFMRSVEVHLIKRTMEDKAQEAVTHVDIVKQLLKGTPSLKKVD